MDDKAWCEHWEDWVRGDHYCNAWQGEERGDDDDDDEDEDDEYPYREQRDVDLTVPAYIRRAAQRGLDLRSEGKGGAGLADRTIREARLMADGEVSRDKVVRVAAWAARHLVDLEAPKNSNADDDDFPGPGAVAFYLWGIDPLDPDPAIAWFDRKREQIAEEEEDRDRSWYQGIAVRDRPGATLFRMSNGVETRRVTVNEFEVRDGENGDGATFVGLAAAFNSPSQPLPFIETIAPGAFSRSLQSRNEIKLFVNHDTSRVLASKRAGTLRLWESGRGLEVEAALPDTTDGRDMAVLLRRGDVDSMSFGFSVPRGGDAWSDDGQERELREVRLHEVSIVTGFPAYEATTAGVRSLDGLVDATGIEAERLNAALSALEAGETLDDDLADVLDAAVTKLRAEREDVQAALAMKQKQLDMLLARV
jgi:HK97 family phage prohead protease